MKHMRTQDARAARRIYQEVRKDTDTREGERAGLMANIFPYIYLCVTFSEFRQVT